MAFYVSNEPTPEEHLVKSDKSLSNFKKWLFFAKNVISHTKTTS